MSMWLNWALAILAISVLAVAVPYRIGSVSAHGGGFQLTERAIAGPYELRLGTIPDPLVVGEAILIMEVSDPITNERVSNIDVRVTPQAPGNATSRSGPIDVWPDSYDPTLYEARMELDIEGYWLFKIDVTGPEGTGQATFTYEVRRVSPIGGIITLMVLLAFLTVLGLSMRAFLKSGGRGQRVRRRKA